MIGSMEEKVVYSVLKDCYERIIKETGISNEAAFDELTKLLFVKWSNDVQKKYFYYYPNGVEWIRENFENIKKDYPYTGLFTPSDTINSRSLTSTSQHQDRSFGDKKLFGHAVGQGAN